MTELLETIALPTLSPLIQEVMLWAIPFAFFTVLTAAIAYLARDLLAKPKPSAHPSGNAGALHSGRDMKIAKSGGQADDAFSSAIAIPTFQSL